VSADRACSCLLQDGNVMEKAGVSVSITHGNLTKQRIEYFAPYHPKLREHVSHKPAEEFPFAVASISLVMHPHNPMARASRSRAAARRGRFVTAVLLDHVCVV
jgi:coproporphyrinogen III oxidase